MRFPQNNLSDRHSGPSNRPRRRHLRHHRPLAALLALCAVWLPAGLALARAGGGEHYTGSGGSDFGGGGGGGAELYVVFELLRAALLLTFVYPGVMIPVWIIAGIVAVLFFRSRPSRTTTQGLDQLEQRRLRPQPDLAAALDSIRQRDPGFSEAGLVDRTRTIFLEIQEAWFRRRLQDVRHVMSDGLHRRFQVLQNLMEVEGRRDAIADVQVHSLRVLEAKRTEGFDVVTLAIRASLRDTEVPKDLDDDAARALAMRAPQQPFVELWTFVRRPGATTRDGYDTVAGGCPNCGAPFDKGATNTCDYCGAIVNSGQYEWVLSEITQASEFLPHHRKAPGLDELRKRDPDAAAEVLEDRALLLFWKWLEGWSMDRIPLMRKVSTPTFLQGQKAERDDYSLKNQRLVIRTPAVGGADVAAVEVDVNGFDRVHVDIRWSAAVSIDENGRVGQGAPRFRRHVLTMIRKSGARTGVEGLATERCGTCRAPLSDSDSATCDYCGHDLTSAATVWQMLSLVPYEQWRRPVLPGELPAGGNETTSTSSPTSPSGVAPSGAARVGASVDPDDLPALASRGERVRLLQAMAAVAAADGVVSDSELKLLRGCARRWRVDWSEIEPQLKREAFVGFGGAAGGTEEERRRLLEAVIAAARVDGRIDASEKRMILTFASHLHIPEDQAKAMMTA